jgi:hypothetical protein
MLYEVALLADDELRSFAWDIERSLDHDGGRLYVSWARGTGAADAQPARPPRAESAAEVAERIASGSADYRLTESLPLAALSRSVDAARPWQNPDATDVLLADPAFDTALGSLAERVARLPEAGWWWHPIAPEQTVTRFFYDDPETRQTQVPARPDPSATAAQLADWRTRGVQTEVQFVDHAERHPRVPLGGAWWSLPMFTAVWTTPQLGSYGPSGLHFVEDSTGESRARVWRAQADDSARVLEIAGADDWAELCRRHPFEVSASRRHVWQQATGREGRWVIPDWVAVAAEWDAVHLTAAGYLRAAERAIPVSPADHTATVLAGWAPGATVWLTDRLRVEPASTDWAYDDSDEAWKPVG